ncbi:MAG: hypothetical protein ABH950_07335 [Candidatus Altiarchaeota archaeon]
MDYTTIQIEKRTRERLSHIRSGRETYDDIINKLLMLVPEGDEEGAYTDDFRISLLNARLDFLKGNFFAHDEVKKQLGL